MRLGYNFVPAQWNIVHNACEEIFNQFEDGYHKYKHNTHILMLLNTKTAVLINIRKIHHENNT